MAECIASIDQGTTSTRCLIFSREAQILGAAQKEHEQIFPQAGWVEHDPLEIWRNTQEVILRALFEAGLTGDDIAGVGITNQRETTLAWNRATGEPYGNAIVWQDTRTVEICRELESAHGGEFFREHTGLPLSTYFSGPKMAWMQRKSPALDAALASEEALFGTIDAWLIWWLTGGPQGGAHISDVTNASRTLLMDLETLDWDEELLAVMGVSRESLPRIAPSSAAEPYGFTRRDGPFGARIPVCAALGDQQAALVGQTCFEKGEAKNTYGTGCFLLLNTGEQPVRSEHGLLATVGYQFGGQPPRYALEGSVAISGALIQWLRDNLGLIRSADEVEGLAVEAGDNGGVYFVPAFSGLFAPYWRPEARGLIIGLTRFADKSHLARAALEATAYQTVDVMQAMKADAALDLRELRVDGGMVVNQWLMQFQADVLGTPVVRPSITETTALGAAYAAGLAVGIWPDEAALRKHWQVDQRWEPQMASDERERLLKRWHQAVERTFDWNEA